MFKSFESSKPMIRNIFMISMISLLTGQFYINPFDTGFRLTLIVIFMSLFLIYYKSYNVFAVTLSVGVATFISRSLVYYVSVGDLSYGKTLLMFAPVLSYYILFGVLFVLLNVRGYLNQPINTFLALLVCDTIPNVIEASIRGVWRLAEFEEILSSIIIVGLIRTLITLSIYYGGAYYIRHFQKNEREKYYKEIIIFISKLRTELFLLKKSSQDIEEMVARVHQLYEESDNEQQKLELLTVAKDVHEIKKDYLRVIAGMSSVFNDDSSVKFLSIKDILALIEDNTKKLINERNKRIMLTTQYDNLFITHEFYTIISLLNNLIINSIDAIEFTGKIHVKVEFDNKDIKIMVEDNGEGIPAEKQKLVFQSGYTTKYDSQTGKTSTGLGLSHVKNIVDKQLLGTIQITSEVGKGTVFTIIIPKESIIKESDY